jgi:purine-nucleoside phosphorylase
MQTPEQKLISCYESIKDEIPFRPRLALILGSGLGALADEIDVTYIIDYDKIKDFPRSTVLGHKGRFVFGYIESVPVVIMQGRVHYYEGYSMQDVVLPTRLMKLMGAEVLFLTNASGGIRSDFKPGTFMMITDHISSFVPSPLIGANFDTLGTRFPDMSQVYCKELQKKISQAAESMGIPLESGVYIQTTGPNFESPAEIRMYRTFGADAVGMSTACEAIAGVHAGMRVCGISCVSNLACGITDNPLTHQEVMEAADQNAPIFKRLIRGCVAAIFSEG